jgi:hypothetical protein
MASDSRMNNTNSSDARTVLEKVRRVLLAILALGMVGTLTELILLKHTEDLVQWVPLVLLGLAGATLVWHSTIGGSASLRLMRWLMCGFVVAGVAGVYFHFQGSAEFKLESQPTLAGMALFWEAIHAKSPPLLAPGMMVQLGLLGLVYTYRHPMVIDSHEKRGE